MDHKSYKNNDAFWQIKLAARLHDPPEKALIVLQDPEGHERGASRVIRQELGLQNLSEDNVQRADGWAAAADRPRFPIQDEHVHWSQRPLLIHPLTGAEYDLKSFYKEDVSQVKGISRQHLQSLIVRKADGSVDWYKTLLAYWRFGPELGETERGLGYRLLWPLLPADTGIPDHSLFEHLDLCSAFAGAFAADSKGEAALLTLSLGPVQSFISAARSTSDLWAGSHLLARLAWEAMQPICELLGPDAVLFPRLRGIPQVDVWLRTKMALGAEESLRKRFEESAGARRESDSNPLFAAALPNRFVALVPAADIQEIVGQIKASVRDWLQGQGESTVNRLLEEAGENGTEEGERYCHQQMRTQLEGFPEFHWAAVPFSLVKIGNKEKQTGLDIHSLRKAMAPFYGKNPNENFGFFASNVWQVLEKENEQQKNGSAREEHGNSSLYAPNPGALYPAIYELAERTMAAVKTVRPFEQTEQKGWRCSLTGETEWLTTDPGQLERTHRQRGETLWDKLAKKRPSWVKNGEHLGALQAIKRLWPTLFAKQLSNELGLSFPRFVVSTHTMAIASQLAAWLEQGMPGKENLPEELQNTETVALPPKLARACGGERQKLEYARTIPALLEEARENDDQQTKKRLSRVLNASADGKGGLETYYALLLMDGDHMGKILSGDEEFSIEYMESIHPAMRGKVESIMRSNKGIEGYLHSKRSSSPGRHMVISAALSDFSLHIAPHIIESEHLGRVIYAGGDDILAMLPVADLLSAVQSLRHAYSGTAKDGDDTNREDHQHKKGLYCSNGYARLDDRLMRMMGEKATASCGAVIAHYQAPLGAVLRELRAAEQRAKKEGGRDAFSLTVIKRSGGVLRVTEKFSHLPSPLELLLQLCKFLAAPGVSRRAVYNSLLWLCDLPKNAAPEMLHSLLVQQFGRQIDKKLLSANAADYPNVTHLVQQLVQLATIKSAPHEWLENFLCVAEFLARETRSFSSLPVVKQELETAP